MEKSNLPAKISKMCDDFVSGLKAIYGDGLVSVMLYGSTVSGEYSSANSNVNLAVVLDDAGLANIAMVACLVNKRKFRPVEPVFFTEKYIASSTDVFPLEFLDMKENNVVLYGKDAMRDVRVDEKNLMFQCEQELKSKLINIKTAYLDHRSASDRKKLLCRFFTSALHLLRNILRLKGRIPPYSREDVIRDAAVEFGIDKAMFGRVLGAKNGSLKLKHGEIKKLFIGFVAEVEKISEAVNRV
ncbi:MAG: hypothetical protein V1927_04410 [Candidatus Omnitrophota bacterium]